jgi:hypothetical protein
MQGCESVEMAFFSSPLSKKCLSWFVFFSFHFYLGGRVSCSLRVIQAHVRPGVGPVFVDLDHVPQPCGKMKMLARFLGNDGGLVAGKMLKCGQDSEPPPT